MGFPIKIFGIKKDAAVFIMYLKFFRVSEDNERDWQGNRNAENGNGVDGHRNRVRHLNFVVHQVILYKPHEIFEIQRRTEKAAENWRNKRSDENQVDYPTLHLLLCDWPISLKKVLTKNCSPRSKTEAKISESLNS